MKAFKAAGTWSNLWSHRQLGMAVTAPLLNNQKSWRLQIRHAKTSITIRGWPPWWEVGLKQWINWLIALNYFPSSGLLDEVTQEVVFFSWMFFFSFHPLEVDLTQDESKAIRVHGSVGSGAPSGPDRMGIVECRWWLCVCKYGGGVRGEGKGGKKMKKNHPGGNLLHCGKKQYYKSPPLLNSAGN